MGVGEGERARMINEGGGGRGLPRVTQTQAHSSAMPSAVFGMQES